MPNQRQVSRKNKTSPTERAMIAFYHGSGMNVREISERTKLSTKCIYRWTKRLASEDSYEPKKPKLDRSMFTDEVKNKIKDYVMANREKTLEEYIKNLQLKCKKSALCKELVKMGLRSRKAPRKEFMNNSHRQIRKTKAEDWVSYLSLFNFVLN